ncbi:MAG TPA: hypothetical protein ENN33_13430, partial [Ignavibacteria bacterium]|nr:hypothetical protein [Ignavibacteria bacterium]
MHEIKILVPRLDNIGGIANYYKTIKKHLCDSYCYVYRGKAHKNESNLCSFIRMLKDYCYFIRKVKIHTKAVVINTSLGKNGFFRDGIFCLLSTNIVKIVFFRGWSPQFEKKINRSVYLKFWLKRTFIHADHIIILSSEFKQKIQNWGYTGGFDLETTVVDESMIRDLDLINLQRKREKDKNTKILYLG